MCWKHKGPLFVVMPSFNHKIIAIKNKLKGIKENGNLLNRGKWNKTNNNYSGRFFDAGIDLYRRESVCCLLYEFPNAIQKRLRDLAPNFGSYNWKISPFPFRTKHQFRNYDILIV